jgi:glyoxylase-like metal-dependent hydrolase (beta-lactamase superfamily II)
VIGDGREAARRNLAAFFLLFSCINGRTAGAATPLNLEDRSMRRGITLAVAFTVSSTLAACGPQAGSVDAANDTLKTTTINSIEFAGTGKWFQFGQAPSPTLPWPQFDVSSYTATVDYQAPAARVRITRLQTVEPGRSRPVPAEQRVDQYVSGTTAWNVPPPPANAAAGAPPPPAQPQPAAVEERVMEIWTTPHGFLKAAAANNATSQPAGGGSEVTFTSNGHRYVGTINANNQVEKVQTWIDNPVLGDTPVEFAYSDYKDFGGVMFPGRIVRTQGGHPVLDVTITSVTANAAVDIAAPEAARAAPAPVTVTSEKLADGVYYLRGGSHHSVVIDQRDHIVVVEGPQLEERSVAVIAKAKELVPNKPIRYLINTHHHFDHSGGLRTYVDEGATIVTHQINRPYYEQAWSAPRTLSPDRLAKSGKTATFETFTEKHVMTDGRRTVEIYQLVGSGHHDGFAMVYLPAEKIVIEGDAYTPLAPGAAAPPAPNPFSVNLLDNIQKLKLDVRQIAALHGPGVATLANLRAYIGQPANATN